MLKYRQKARTIESKIREVIMAYFNLSHRERAGSVSEHWYPKHITYGEDHMEIDMFWEASWRYGGYDCGSYEFQMDYSCLDMNEAALILKEEADRKEAERLKKIADEEEKKRREAYEAEQREKKDRQEYLRLQKKFGGK